MTHVRPDRDEQARRFRAMHAQPPLVLPNAWDAASAAVMVIAGATAIATTSAGISWSRGARDGGGLSRHQAIESIAAIVQAVDVPVTADIEAGYGPAPDDVADTVEQVIAAGAVGINIEDTPDGPAGPLLEAGAQAERIRAARDRAESLQSDLWINARTDTFLTGPGTTFERIDMTLERAAIYAAAGADSLFVPGTVAPEIVAALADGPLPLNIMVGPGASSVGQFASLGVARISVGAALAHGVYSLALRATRELLLTGTYMIMRTELDYDLNAHFAGT